MAKVKNATLLTKECIINEKYMLINKVYVYAKNLFREVKVLEIKMIK